MANAVLEIDGESFNDVINFVKIQREAHFFDKFAKRDINGILHRELIGVYINYKLEIGVDGDLNNYNNLWEKLTEKAEKHDIIISSNTHYEIQNNNKIYYNLYHFEAYFASIKDEAIKLRNNNNQFRKLSVDFIATKPHVKSNAYFKR